MAAVLGFIFSPLGKFLGVLALVVALFFGAKHYAHQYLDGVRDDVRQEYTVRDLKAAVAQAEKDRKFAETQQAKAEQQAKELREDLTTALGKIKSSSTVIHERVSSGELQNGQSSPLITATVDRIDVLEAERKTGK